MHFVSPNFKIISVPITPSSGSTPSSTIFPTQQDLQNRKIIAIETFCALDIDFDPENSGASVLSTVLFTNGFLTLYTSAIKSKTSINKKQEPGLFYDKLPLVKLRNIQNNDTNLTPLPSNGFELFCIRPTELAFNKCKVEFPTGIAMPAAESAVFGFHYLDEGDDGIWWMKAMGFDYIVPAK